MKERTLGEMQQAPLLGDYDIISHSVWNGECWVAWHEAKDLRRALQNGTSVEWEVSPKGAWRITR